MRLLRGIENDADVHHDVDKQAVFGEEGAQIVPVSLIPQTHGAAGLDDHVVPGLIIRQVIPAFPGGPESETQVMHSAVGLAMFDEVAVVFRLRSPPGIAGMQINQPELPAKETFTPVGPGLSLVHPFTVGGIYGESVGADSTRWRSCEAENWMAVLHFAMRRSLFGTLYLLRQNALYCVDMRRHYIYLATMA